MSAKMVLGDDWLASGSETASLSAPLQYAACMTVRNCAILALVKSKNESNGLAKGFCKAFHITLHL